MGYACLKPKHLCYLILFVRFLKMWNITEEDYQAVAVISSDESDHQLPFQLIELVPQQSVKGFCCISQETQNQHHNHFEA